MGDFKKIPINCGKCGRFVGKDGFEDVYYDEWNGGWECGSPRCGKCLKKEMVKKASSVTNPTSLPETKDSKE